MSESVADSYKECDGRNGQSMYSFPSVWIARLTRTGQSAAEKSLSSPNPCESKKSDDRTRLLGSAAELGNTSNLNLSAGGLRKFGTLTREVVNESLGTSSRNQSVEGSAYPSPAMSTPCRIGLSSKDGQGSHGFLALKPYRDAKTSSVVAKESSMLPEAPAATGKHCSEPEPSLPNPIKTHLFFRQSDAVESMPSLDNCRASASHIVPYRFDYGKFKDNSKQTAMPLIIDRGSKSQRPNSSLGMFESEPGKSKNVPSPSNSHPSEFHGDWFHKLQGGSHSVVFRNSRAPQELPRSMHDVKTMRICTVDSVVGLTGGYPRFSQTTHSLLIMKKTDVNLCEQHQTAGTSGTCNKFNDLDNLSLRLGQNQQGVKLQLLDSSTASEHEEDIGGAEPSGVEAKNESSAETDTMDIDVFPGKNQLLGVNSFPFKKLPERDQKLPQLTLGFPVEQAGSEEIRNRLPDINLQLPAIQAEATTSTEHLEPSSKTQSLDMESLLAHAEKPSNSKPDLLQFNPLGPEPGSRWVKRLRLSNHGLSHGTRSSNSKEDSSHEKYRLRGKNTQGGIASSDPTTSKHQDKKLMVRDQCAGLTRNSESYSSDTVKTGKELLTSHSWIQRLIRNKATNVQKKPEVVVCEPQSSKLVPEDLEKKQFPSIAAMALMGKAMKGFQPCEFQEKGSFVVWNANGI